MPLARRLVSEAVGTALLLATIVGSGIMAERLSGGNEALALLCNSTATGAILVVLIAVFGQVSGTHLNPASPARGAKSGIDVRKGVSSRPRAPSA
jgi:glycerol uptake facilitator-like aquaporin